MAGFSVPAGSTAGKVLAVLIPYRLQAEGDGEWRFDAPWRPGADSHGVRLKIDDMSGEKGTWFDHVASDRGSLYDLASRLGVSRAAMNGHKAPPAAAPPISDLDTYAQLHGVSGDVFRAAAWQDARVYQGRPALRFATATGDKVRFLDGTKPKFKPTTKGYQPSWYRLTEAIALAHANGQPLVICNGEPSVLTAQHYGIAATAHTGGEGKDPEKEPYARLLIDLLAAWAGPILIAFDCDAAGRTGAEKWRDALTVAGRAVLALDLNGGSGFDLAEFCMLHRAQSAQQLQQCQPVGTNGPAAPPPTIISGLVPGSAPALAVDALQRRGYAFQRNVMTGMITVTLNGQALPLDDALEASIHAELYSDGFKSSAMLANVITRLAAEESHHPVREWLDSLVWDGENVIEQLAACLHSSDTAVEYDNGEIRPLAAVYVERFLIGAVDRAFSGAQNMMLVLSGAQGIGKSQFARWLGGGVAETFYEGPINPNDKDCLILQSSKWLWEVSELDATTRRADVSALKDFITRESVTVRLPYGKRSIVRPALASCIGTVNDATGFLSDPTGNRRFLVLTLTGIDWHYRDIPLEQLWAQAVTRYRAGETGRLSPNELRAQVLANLSHEVSDPLEDWITKHFVIGGPSCMTMGDIIDHLTSRGYRLHGSERAQATNIGFALTRLGVKRGPRPHRGSRLYEGITPGSTPNGY